MYNFVPRVDTHGSLKKEPELAIGELRISLNSSRSLGAASSSSQKSGPRGAKGDIARRSQARVTFSGHSTMIDDNNHQLHLKFESSEPTKYLDNCSSSAVASIPGLRQITADSHFILQQYKEARNVFKLVREGHLDPYTGGLFDSGVRHYEDLNMRSQTARYLPNPKASTFEGQTAGTNLDSRQKTVEHNAAYFNKLGTVRTIGKSDIQFYFKLIKNNNRVFGNCESNFVRKIIDWSAFTSEQETENVTDADVCNWFFKKVMTKPNMEGSRTPDATKSMLDLPILSEDRSVGKGTVYHQEHGNTLAQAEELNQQVQKQRQTTLEMLKGTGQSEFDPDETKSLLSLLLRDTTSQYGSSIADHSKENSVSGTEKSKETATPNSKLNDELGVFYASKRQQRKKEQRTSKTEIYKHILTDDLNPGTRYLDCFVCGCIVEITQILDYIKHVEAHKLPPLAPYYCTLCKSLFSDHDALLYHFRFHHHYE